MSSKGGGGKRSSHSASKRGMSASSTPRSFKPSSSSHAPKPRRSAGADHPHYMTHGRSGGGQGSGLRHDSVTSSAPDHVIGSHLSPGSSQFAANLHHSLEQNRKIYEARGEGQGGDMHRDLMQQQFNKTHIDENKQHFEDKPYDRPFSLNDMPSTPYSRSDAYYSRLKNEVEADYYGDLEAKQYSSGIKFPEPPTMSHPTSLHNQRIRSEDDMTYLKNQSYADKIREDAFDEFELTRGKGYQKDIKDDSKMFRTANMDFTKDGNLYGNASFFNPNNPGRNNNNNNNNDNDNVKNFNTHDYRDYQPPNQEDFDSFSNFRPTSKSFRPASDSNAVNWQMVDQTNPDWKNDPSGKGPKKMSAAEYGKTVEDYNDGYAIQSHDRAHRESRHILRRPIDIGAKPGTNIEFWKNYTMAQKHREANKERNPRHGLKLENFWGRKNFANLLRQSRPRHPNDQYYGDRHQVRRDEAKEYNDRDNHNYRSAALQDRIDRNHALLKGYDLAAADQAALHQYDAKIQALRGNVNQLNQMQNHVNRLRQHYYGRSSTGVAMKSNNNNKNNTSGLLNDNPKQDAILRTEKAIEREFLLSKRGSKNVNRVGDHNNPTLVTSSSSPQSGPSVKTLVLEDGVGNNNKNNIFGDYNGDISSNIVTKMGQLGVYSSSTSSPVDNTGAVGNSVSVTLNLGPTEADIAILDLVAANQQNSAMNTNRALRLNSKSKMDQNDAKMAKKDEAQRNRDIHEKRVMGRQEGQNDSKMDQNGTKMAQNDTQMAQNGPKTASTKKKRYKTVVNADGESVQVTDDEGDDDNDDGRDVMMSNGNKNDQNTHKMTKNDQQKLKNLRKNVTNAKNGKIMLKNRRNGGYNANNTKNITRPTNTTIPTQELVSKVRNVVDNNTALQGQEDVVIPRRVRGSTKMTRMGKFGSKMGPKSAKSAKMIKNRSKRTPMILLADNDPNIASLAQDSDELTNMLTEIERNGENETVNGTFEAESGDLEGQMELLDHFEQRLHQSMKKARRELFQTQQSQLIYRAAYTAARLEQLQRDEMFVLQQQEMMGRFNNGQNGPNGQNGLSNEQEGDFDQNNGQNNQNNQYFHPLHPHLRQQQAINDQNDMMGGMLALPRAFQDLEMIQQRMENDQNGLNFLQNAPNRQENDENDQNDENDDELHVGGQLLLDNDNDDEMFVPQVHRLRRDDDDGQNLQENDHNRQNHQNNGQNRQNLQENDQIDGDEEVFVMPLIFQRQDGNIANLTGAIHANVQNNIDNEGLFNQNGQNNVNFNPNDQNDQNDQNNDSFIINYPTNSLTQIDINPALVAQHEQAIQAYNPIEMPSNLTSRSTLQQQEQHHKVFQQRITQSSPSFRPNGVVGGPNRALSPSFRASSPSLSGINGGGMTNIAPNGVGLITTPARNFSGYSNRQGSPKFPHNMGRNGQNGTENDKNEKNEKNDKNDKNDKNGSNGINSSRFSTVQLGGRSPNSPQPSSQHEEFFSDFSLMGGKVLTQSPSLQGKKTNNGQNGPNYQNFKPNGSNHTPVFTAALSQINQMVNADRRDPYAMHKMTNSPTFHLNSDDYIHPDVIQSFQLDEPSSKNNNTIARSVRRSSISNQNSLNNGTMGKNGSIKQTGSYNGPNNVQNGQNGPNYQNFGPNGSLSTPFSLSKNGPLSSGAFAFLQQPQPFPQESQQSRPTSSSTSNNVNTTPSSRSNLNPLPSQQHKSGQNMGRMTTSGTPGKINGVPIKIGSQGASPQRSLRDMQPPTIQMPIPISQLKQNTTPISTQGSNQTRTRAGSSSSVATAGGINSIAAISLKKGDVNSPQTQQHSAISTTSMLSSSLTPSPSPPQGTRSVAEPVGVSLAQMDARNADNGSLDMKREIDSGNNYAIGHIDPTMVNSVRFTHQPHKANQISVVNDVVERGGDSML